MGLDERVLVIPSSEFDRLGRFQGFASDAERYLSALLVPSLSTFKARRDVEDDPSFKQIIPYVIFRSGDSVFTYRRGKTQGESRLHALRSIGVGGHVSEADAEGRGTREAYDLALARELDEEVAIASDGTMTCVGLINDDSNPVGQVHLGVVHLYSLERPEVSPREDGLADPVFLPIDGCRAALGEFETWSRYCIESLFRAHPTDPACGSESVEFEKS